MAKRKNGEGTWGEKTINGVKYKYFRIKYPNVDKAKDFYGKTEKEIIAKRKAFEKELRDCGKFDKDYGKKIFGNYIEDYLKTELKNLTPNGYDSYEKIIRTQIKNLKEYDLYNKQLDQINESILQSYVDALVEHGYALKTIKKVCGLISQCLNYAETNGHISRNNMKKVKMPTEENVSKKKKEHLFFSKEQMELFCKCATHIESEDDRYNHGIKIGEYTYGHNGLALAFIGQTGLRAGETIGLDWSCVDFNKNVIKVFNSESVVIARDKDGNAIKYTDKSGKTYTKKTRHRKDTKTEHGMRFVPMTNMSKDILKYFEKYKTSSDSRVFVNTKQNPLQIDNLRRTLHAICKRCDLPVISPHELRHSYGSIILHQEHIDIQVVSKLLGHKDISTTYNIYTHVLSEIMAESVKVFDQKS